MDCMAQYTLRLRDCGIGSLAAKLYLIFTFPQKAGCNQHVRVVDHSVIERSTVGTEHPNPGKKSHMTKSEVEYRQRE